MSSKNSNETSWDRTSDLPICSTAPSPLCHRGSNWTAADRKNTQKDRAYIGLVWLTKGTAPLAGGYPCGNGVLWKSGISMRDQTKLLKKDSASCQLDSHVGTETRTHDLHCLLSKKRQWKFQNTQQYRQCTY